MTARHIALILLQLLALIVLVLGAIAFGDWVKTTFDMQILPLNESMAYWILLLSLMLYALVLAVPFVPGAEIGLSLIAVFGAAAAPWVYLATVVGLSLAFLVGSFVPPAATCKLLTRLGLIRLSDLIADAHAARLQGERSALFANLRNPLLLRLARYRYLTLALLLNVPGNALIGGGGGLSLMAGLSGTFKTGAFLATIALAVLPVPFAVYVIGINI